MESWKMKSWKIETWENENLEIQKNGKMEIWKN